MMARSFMCCVLFYTINFGKCGRSGFVSEGRVIESYRLLSFMFSYLLPVDDALSPLWRMTYYEVGKLFPFFFPL